VSPLTLVAVSAASLVSYAALILIVNRAHARSSVPLALRKYAPGSPEQIALFTHAARVAGLPPEWGASPGLANILRRESAGIVGRPNYTYKERAVDERRWPEVWAELRAGKIHPARDCKRERCSSATGLGQLLLRNVDTYYPGATTAERRAGIGHALPEAIGMLQYIRSRYGDPERAWALYGKLHEGY
jgi:hypothetical protein